MELRYLDTFICAAELGSFTLAARHLNYAQSTVTTQIDSLEKELHVKLFDRNGKRITVSAAGRDLLQYAYRFQQLENDLHYHFNGNEQISGSLHVGIIESLSVSKYMKGIEQFMHNCPDITLTILMGTVADVREMLHKGEIDIAFLFDRPVNDDELQTLISVPKKVLFITAPDDPILTQKHITLEDISTKDWYLTESGCNYRRILDDTLSDRRLLIKRRLEIGQTRFLIQFVKRGLGISFLPEFCLMEELQRKTVAEIPIEDCKISMELQLLIHKNRWLSPTARLFSKHIMAAMRR